MIPITDHDLHSLFKEHHNHSVAAACRAIYDQGFADGAQSVYDDIAGSHGAQPPSAIDVSGAFVPPVLSVGDHVANLLAVAHAADQPIS